jgi:hypothetical protein
MGDTKVAGGVVVGDGRTCGGKGHDGGEKQSAHIELRLPLIEGSGWAGRTGQAHPQCRDLRTPRK